MGFTTYILPLLLSCFTGWFVIWILIKLFFRPYKPVHIAGFKIQGIVAANQQQIAEKIGRLVSTELFSFEALQEKATNPENFNKLKPEIETNIDIFLRERLKYTFPMLSMLIGDKKINQLKTAFLLELESLFPVVMKSYLAGLENELDLEKMITQKIAGFSISKTEGLVLTSAKKQLVKLQVLGAAIGLLLGLVYILLLTVFFN
jgi:uncharacterized membrane protein YheB (UPF0754 family)